MADNTIGTATVMFTDVVGSTELRLRVGEDAADAIRATHDRILTEAVESNHGRVVKRLGDGVMATFASCTDGLSAAVTIQQSVDLANRRRRGERLAVRIGLAVGDVSFEGDDCFGLSVVEAQRLESAAQPDSIWCTDIVAHLARGRGSHEFRSVGALSLKGLPDQVPASEVCWEPIREVSPRDDRLPAVLAGTGFPFSGRTEVFDRLVERWRHCAGGGFEATFIAGEPGIGKTRLAQELAHEAGVDAAAERRPEPLVLAGRCDEEGAPFQAFGTALEWFVRSETPEVAALGEFPGDLDRLVPHLRDLVDDLPPALRGEPDAERFRLFAAVESWLRVGGADRPRLLVIDDLQWADRPTLLLIKQLIQHQPPGLMVVGTYRDTDVGRSHALAALLAEVRGTDGVTRIGLEGLAPDGVRELLVRAGGHELDDIGRQFADRVQRETSGNPLFVGELLRHLIENGTLVERGGQWTSDLGVDEAGIPDGVREVVGQRVHRLGDEVERVLRSAAVIGYEFEAGLLAEVLDVDVDGVLDALDAAISASLVVELSVDRHRFAHGLVRETLHSEMSSSRSVREHRKVALALESRHADSLDQVISELAVHWAAASVGGDRSRAIELTLRAGELAAARGAYENGSAWFERALELMADDAGDWSSQRRHTLVLLADAEGVSGSTADARTHALAAARAAVEADDPETVVAALRVRARHSFSASDPADPERLRVLRDALSMTSLGPWQRAALLGEMAKELIFERDVDGRRRVLDEQQVLLAQLPARQRVELVATAGATSFEPTGPAALRRHAAEARSVLDGEAELSASDRWRIHGHLAYTALHLGDRVALDHEIAEMTTFGVEIGAVRTAMTSLHQAMRSVVVGDLADAQSIADLLVGRLQELGVPDAAAYAQTTTLAISRERGSLIELAPIVEELAASAHPAGPERATAAFVDLQRGDVDLVWSALHDLDRHQFADDATMQLCIAFWSEIVAALRSEAHCGRFIELLDDAAGANLLIGGLYLGPVDRLLAQLHDALGAHGRADELFEAAIAQQADLASPPWIARTTLDWASACLARGDRKRAGALVAAIPEVLGDLDLADARRRHGDLVARLASGA